MSNWLALLLNAHLDLPIDMIQAESWPSNSPRQILHMCQMRDSLHNSLLLSKPVPINYSRWWLEANMRMISPLTPFSSQLDKSDSVLLCVDLVP